MRRPRLQQRAINRQVVRPGKRNVVLRKKLLKTSQTNLSPLFIQVYVSSRMITPDGANLPQAQPSSKPMCQFLEELGTIGHFAKKKRSCGYCASRYRYLRSLDFKQRWK